MARELKFRLWDKETRQMKVPGDTHDVFTFYKDGTAQYYNLQNGSGGGEYEIMQFTGRRDKNGREEYQGDIVRQRFLDEDGNEIAQEINVIIWEEIGAFAYAPSLKHRGLTVRDFWQRYKNARHIEDEVLGNIFEQPDLLPEDDQPAGVCSVACDNALTMG